MNIYDLLAVIHRDGGHYTAKHGEKKSLEDAIEIISNCRGDLESEIERRVELQKAIDKFCEKWDNSVQCIRPSEVRTLFKLRTKNELQKPKA